jgi:type I restriction enzyme, S subunit
VPNIQTLTTDNLTFWTSSIKAKSSPPKGTRNKFSLHGIQKLRELILQLSIQGKLVPNDPNDEPASKLLSELRIARQKLISDGIAKPSQKHKNLGKPLHLFSLPKNWNWEYLAYIPLWPLKDGDWVESKDQDPDGEVRLVQLADVGDGHYRNRSARFLTANKAKELNCLFILSGDILIARLPNPIGRACVFPEDPKPCVTVVDVAICRCDSRFINRNFIVYALNSNLIREQISKYVTGTTRQRISTGNLGQIQIPIPPLSQQTQIVAKIDHLMSLCDQLEQQTEDSITAHQTLVETLLATLTESKDAEEFAQNWSRVAGHFDTLFTTEHSIDQLKQTILQLAIMGKLVPQDPSDEPASVLLENIAAEKERLVKEGKIKKQKLLPPIDKHEKPFKLPKGWEWCRLQDAIDVRDGTHDSPRDAVGDNTFPLVTSKDFNNGGINFDSARRISEKDHFEIIKRSLVEVDDILFSMIGGNIGNQVMVKDTRPFSIKNVALFKYYDKNSISPLFLKLYLEDIAEGLQEKASGGAQPFISLGALRKLVFAIPPVAEQHRIVAKVEELMILCDQLSESINNAQTIQTHLAEVIVEQAVA